MNYRHTYHAGSFADVFKHVVLTLLIKHLLQKEKGFCYLETHAGCGCYNLFSEASQRTKEYRSGIQSLWSENLKLPAEITDYLAIVKNLNPDNQLKYYPGSPLIARQFLRPQDRMVLAELHPEEAEQLKHNFARDKQVAVHVIDGYQALKAFIPPKENRGLVLIDPPYEKPDETGQALDALKTALKHWANGTYAVWYPIKDRQQANKFLNKLHELANKEMLVTELSIYHEDSPMSLNGSGMAIINPPWQLDEQLKSLLPELWRLLSPNGLGKWVCRLE